jgi:hypothetical protein
MGMFETSDEQAAGLGRKPCGIAAPEVNAP